MISANFYLYLCHCCCLCVSLLCVSYLSCGRVKSVHVVSGQLWAIVGIYGSWFLGFPLGSCRCAQNVI